MTRRFLSSIPKRFHLTGNYASLMTLCSSIETSQNDFHMIHLIKISPTLWRRYPKMSESSSQNSEEKKRKKYFKFVIYYLSYHTFDVWTWFIVTYWRIRSISHYFLTTRNTICLQVIRRSNLARLYLPNGCFYWKKGDELFCRKFNELENMWSSFFI